MNSVNQFICSAILLIAFTSVTAQERLDMKGTSIIGNKELPKVLYIVPWKSAGDINLTTPPFISVLDEALKPVERTTFQRQVRYYQNLYPAPETASIK